jgi:hypothetical protein
MAMNKSMSLSHGAQVLEDRGIQLSNLYSLGGNKFLAVKKTPLIRNPLIKRPRQSSVLCDYWGEK